MQAGFGQINVQLNAAQDFIGDGVVVAQLQDGPAFHQKNALILFRALRHSPAPPDPDQHLDGHRPEAEHPKQVARAGLREVEPVVAQEKCPGDGIVDMIAQRRAAAGEVVRGDHAAQRGVPAKRHPAGSHQSDGPAAQRQRADGHPAAGQQPDAEAAERKESDAQAARGDAAHGNAAAGI